ncbi:MAG: hypothetical protein R6V08_06630 [Desulfuromonadales bacterium]
MAFPQAAVLTLANRLRYFMVILRGVFLEGGSMALFWPRYWLMASATGWCPTLSGTSKKASPIRFCSVPSNTGGTSTRRSGSA